MVEFGSFVMEQILKMQWLSDAVGAALAACGVNLASQWGGSLHFFLYDTLKIVILLVTLIFVISYIQSFFPPERSRRIMGRFKGIRGNVAGRSSRHGDPVLQLQLHSPVHWIHPRRAPLGSHVQLPHLIAHGRPRQPGAHPEHLQPGRCARLHRGGPSHRHCRRSVHPKTRRGTLHRGLRARRRTRRRRPYRDEHPRPPLLRCAANLLDF